MCDICCPYCDKWFDEYDDAATGYPGEYLYQCPSCKQPIFLADDDSSFQLLYRHVISDLPVDAVVLRSSGQRYRRVRFPPELELDLLWPAVFISKDERQVFACKREGQWWEPVKTAVYLENGERPQVSLPLVKKANGKRKHTRQKTYRLVGYAWGDLAWNEVVRHENDDRQARGLSNTKPGTRVENGEDFHRARRNGKLPKRGLVAIQVRRAIVDGFRRIYGLRGSKLNVLINKTLADHVRHQESLIAAKLER